MLRSALEEYVSSASSCVNCLGKSVAKSLNGASELHLEVIETVRSREPNSRPIAVIEFAPVSTPFSGASSERTGASNVNALSLVMKTSDRVSILV